ncbi:MAG: ribonuclease HII [Candidatus Kaiserbacteria bacterium]|nr:MAG: ribonuclease HII [Candidatus Kaiserbacteria bacterium]
MRYVIGIDEAGRGPLAGPVAVGAVLLPEDFDWLLLEGVRDSKQLRPQVRDSIFEQMQVLESRGKIRYAVRFSSCDYIDEFGIVSAIRRALYSAIYALEPQVAQSTVLLDGGLRAPREFFDQHTIIRGDETEPVISLASIAAKVLRDRRMEELSEHYPDYGFDVHKGYATLAHRRAIARHGLSDLHRVSFCSRLRIGPKMQQPVHA